jgi:hypothetical protein
VKKLVLILVPILLLGGAATAIFTGLLHVPGLSPAKKAAAAQLYAEEGDELEKAKAPPSAVSEPVDDEPPRRPPPGPQIAVLPEEGDRRLAVLWNELESAKLSQIVADWKDDELARVLVRMDDDKVAALMASLAPERASKLSKALQRETSRVLVGPDGKPVGD